MKKLSVKLGMLFFLIIFSLITFIFFFLHKGIAEYRIEEELSSLQARGNSHRAILEKHFDMETMEHVALMESESTTDVVITDNTGKVLTSSTPTQLIKHYLKAPPIPISKKGEIVEKNWKEELFIATVSPIYEKEELSGYVYMFQNTDSVQSFMERLNDHFILAGWISISLTIIMIFFLSKGITKPLIKMKEATSQISKGNFSVSIPKTSNDELGDLAQSIELLANDLSYLKKERSEFLASISHEIRTPLTYIKGYADILAKRNLSINEKEKYSKIIVEETSRLSNLIKELFELAKLDQHTFVIQKEPINLTEFLRNIQLKLLLAFQEKDIKFKLNCSPHLFLNADPLKLEQIIINILDNAMKYSEEGACIQIIVSKNKHSVSIVIQDNGKGIPEKDIPYIFNRFYRVDKSRSRSLGGTGLGLAIVKELVHAHNAEIQVKSKENIGTKFIIVFKGDQ